jgi:hypothetical protein
LEGGDVSEQVFTGRKRESIIKISMASTFGSKGIITMCFECALCSGMTAECVIELLEDVIKTNQSQRAFGDDPPAGYKILDLVCSKYSTQMDFR